MKFTFLGTAAAEGWPALFCNCINCKKARELAERESNSTRRAELIKIAESIKIK